ncbi:TPA: UDP-N-acetylmuramate--L-alanine ligase [Candidatus Scatousia excrementigallinarum]|uniref:UDP-N-acetylmuramate--L-alanine ligase n=1 Tax=Candidatus Scatousia excrementigallinarum TaxID=2840935 RepID=A0A9D1EX79_9BACT|nr:UDP-N-acetylmuramate--L-alanine ligase [Candidatus Scatousia excrementigallinarum]
MNRQKYYFIAIGGVGMSGLAKYLLENGCEVSGSDVCDGKYVQKVKKLGANVHIGHSADNVPQDCVVIASTAIRQDNPEMIRAKELGLPIYHRSDLLAEISREGKFFLGYSGTHGKTTTSGLSSYVMEKAGLKPSYVVGGIIPELDTNAHCQDGKYFAAELDESDGTIVKYVPNVVVINNLEADHLDFYKNGLQSILETFESFISKMPDDGVVLVNYDCEASKGLHGHKTMTFGLSDGADYQAKNIEYTSDYTSFDVYFKNELLIDLKIILKGRHNVYNALSVLASLHQAGVDLEVVKPHFATFTGMGRRFQKIGVANGAVIYDDYAHHPTEIKAALSSALSFKDKHIIAVFQPHRYTRLKNLWNEFLTAFDGVDKVIVTDVYAASEDKIEGVNSKVFCEDLNKKGVNCEYISGDMKSVANVMFPDLNEKDVVIGLGAGTVTALGKELIALDKELTNVAG